MTRLIIQRHLVSLTFFSDLDMLFIRSHYYKLVVGAKSVEIHLLCVKMPCFVHIVNTAYFFVLQNVKL